MLCGQSTRSSTIQGQKQLEQLIRNSTENVIGRLCRGLRFSNLRDVRSVLSTNFNINTLLQVSQRLRLHATLSYKYCHVSTRFYGFVVVLDIW